MFPSFEYLKLSGCQGYFFACFFILISWQQSSPVPFWFRKVDFEDIIKHTPAIGRFFFIDFLLSIFLLVNIVHFLYLQICLKMLFISFSATIMGINKGKELMWLMITCSSAGKTRHYFHCLPRPSLFVVAEIGSFLWSTS